MQTPHIMMQLLVNAYPNVPLTQMRHIVPLIVHIMNKQHLHIGYA